MQIFYFFGLRYWLLVLYGCIQLACEHERGPGLGFSLLNPVMRMDREEEETWCCHINVVWLFNRYIYYLILQDKITFRATGEADTLQYFYLSPDTGIISVINTLQDAPRSTYRVNYLIRSIDHYQTNYTRECGCHHRLYLNL